MSRKNTVLLMLGLIVIMQIFILCRWRVTVEVNGGKEITIPYGATYQDAGATARFEGKDIGWFDHEIKLHTRGEVNTDKLGTYKIRYRASNLFYHGSAVRTVTVADTTAPTLSFRSEETTIRLGDAWTDGFVAIDDMDGDVTSQVQVDGTVDTNQAGTYVLTYTVSDAAGNLADVQRTFTVIDEVEPVTDSKIVFLTFDDGPGEYTDELLDILAAHNAKATFFVTAGYPEYQYCIGREYEEGHSIAVHCFTHDYGTVYASDEAFWADFDHMNSIIAEEIGHETNIFRFPGGSSNTVSSGNPGIMTRLAAQSKERGLQYFDWNIDSGDAGGTTTSDGVYENITGQIQYANEHGVDQMVVLCHDTHSWTLGAMDRVLTWLEDNGYTLMPLHKGSVECHHGIAN